jgi:6-phosphofructokinase 1
MSSSTSIGVLSSGTDNSGVNGAIRAIVRSAGARERVVGIRWGYRGLVDNEFTSLTTRDVSGVIGRAGCFLGTAKPEGVLTPAALDRAVANLEKRGIDRLIVVGGLQSLLESRKLVARGIRVIGVPCTIQDDIGGTDISIGVDSAVNNIVRSIDNIRGNSLSRHRLFLVEVEGRGCASLALRSALVSGADFCLVPEQPSLESEEMRALVGALGGNARGRTQLLALVAVGWRPGIEQLEAFLQDKERDADLHVRTTVLGYVQRGGAPSGFDRLLGTKMGSIAMRESAAGASAKLVALKEGDVVTRPYEDALVHAPFPRALYDIFKTTR